MLQMLQTRLSFFSNGRVTRFATVCRPNLHDVDHVLVQESQGLPRNLLRFGAHVLSAHNKECGDCKPRLISKKAFESAKRNFIDERPKESESWVLDHPTGVD